MSNPTILTNTMNPGTIVVGSSTSWRTVAVDADARTAQVQRTAVDSQGGQVVFMNQVVVTDPITYGPPSSPDPKLSFVVDPSDPTQVTITVNP